MAEEQTKRSVAEDWQALVDRVIAGGRLLEFRRLHGGVSAEATALEVLGPDGDRIKLVVRKHGEADWRCEPHVSAREFALMKLLHGQGMPVPKPYLAGGIGGTDELPYIVVEYIEGASGMDESDRPGGARRLAEALAKLHRIDTGLLHEPGLRLERQAERVTATLARRLAKLDESLDEPLIRGTLEAGWPPASANADAILHGDYWPGNTLWREGSLAAIIDWEDAAIGDPLADLANARLEIAWAYGEEAAEEFEERYRAAMPQLSYDYLYLWELVAALRPASRLQDWGLDRETEERMRAVHARFVRQALSRIR